MIAPKIALLNVAREVASIEPRNTLEAHEAAPVAGIQSYWLTKGAWP